jgi:hypothetical protein
MADNSNDEEISSILRFFCPRPRFATSGIGSTENERPLQKRQPLCRGYSRVKFDAPGNRIVLTYLHMLPPFSTEVSSFPLAVYLSFEVSLATKSVKCIQCSATTSSIAKSINERIDVMCLNRLSSEVSLFSFISRLLQLLNSDIPKIEHGVAKAETFHGLIQRANIAQQVQMQLIDLQVLLLRCASAGRTRAHTLSPVPIEFTLRANGDGDALAHLIFNASNELYFCGFRGSNTQLPGGKQTLEAWELLSFILSLPISDSQLLKDESCDNTPSRNIVGNLTIEMNAGDPPPSFTRHAIKYGTIQTFHGTKIESAWSILNHGLQNLSYNKALSQNGAMLGEGVYLSSSRQVAEGFAIMATERPSRVLSYAFEHESLLHLLAYTNVNVSKLDPLDTYDIKCLPVFEATIIKPPEDDTDFDKRISRQEGKYFVCEDSEFVQVSKLHLKFELTKKANVWAWLPRVPFSLMVFLVVLFWSLKSV